MKATILYAKLNEKEYDPTGFAVRSVGTETLLRCSDQWSRISPRHSWIRNLENEKTFLFFSPERMRAKLSRLQALGAVFSLSLQGTAYSIAWDETRWFMHSERINWGEKEFRNVIMTFAEGHDEDELSDYNDLLIPHIKDTYVFSDGTFYKMTLTSVKVHVILP